MLPAGRGDAFAGCEEARRSAVRRERGFMVDVVGFQPPVRGVRVAWVALQALAIPPEAMRRGCAPRRDSGAMFAYGAGDCRRRQCDEIE